MSDTRIHVFIVEDDANQRDLLARYLERNDMRVTPMSSGEEMLQRIHRTRPDLVVLDLGLPGIGGLQACQRLRLEGDRLPVILLTARDEEVDRVLGLESGADDYLTKPFSARELVARIRAVLRRAASPFPVAAGDAAVDLGAWRLLPAEQCLVRGSEVRVLNAVEFALLCELARSPGTAVSRERLVAASHSRGDQVSPRAIDAAIMRLRKLVEPDPARPVFIRTVRGAGYMYFPAKASGSASATG